MRALVVSQAADVSIGVKAASAAMYAALMASVTAAAIGKSHMGPCAGFASAYKVATGATLQAVSLFTSRPKQCCHSQQMLS